MTRGRRAVPTVMAVAAAVLAAVVAASALLPAAGRAAAAAPTIASPNVTLLANVPTGSGVGGKFAGGYYFHTTARSPDGVRTPDDPWFRPTASPVGGLVVLDVTVPEQPVPAAFLPISIWQNEDVDLSWNRKVLLISKDADAFGGGVLYVVDISVPRAPFLRGILNLPERVADSRDRLVRGPGHTASCILDCTYAYVAGSFDGAVWLIDLRDPNRPTLAGKVFTEAASGDGGPHGRGAVHDVHVDATGHVLMSGTGGTVVYAPLRDPLRPQVVAKVTGPEFARAGAPFHHGALRLDADTLLVTEENFGREGCGRSKGIEVFEDGGLQTWRLDRPAGALRFVAEWDIDLPHPGADKQVCSSHWFDVNAHRVVADAWYEGGVRFFDLSDPARIRPIGFLTGEGTIAGQAQFFPGRPDLVYVSDYARGLDVVRINGGGKGAPTLAAESPIAPRPVVDRRDRIRPLSCRIG